MIKKITLGIALLVCSAVISFAQTGNITGSVKTSDGQPAEFVNVGLKGSAKGTVTDKDGKFQFNSVATGSYTLVTSYIGLQTQEQTVEVKEGETVNIDFMLTESAKELQEIVVTSGGNRYKENTPSQSLRVSTPLIELPQNVQVVTTETLKDQQVISMSDGVLRNVSGVARAEHWGDLYTNVVARGSQIQAFRNGFNVVNSYWGPLTEDMSFVDRIEFVKGPAGFMLSSGDPSGLYNVVTKKPTGQTKGEATITVGSYDLYRGALDLDGKISNNGKLLYRLNLAAQNKKSHRSNEYNDRYTIAPVISYQLDEKTKLTFEYTYQRANMSNVGSYYIFSPTGFGAYPVDFTYLPPGTPGTKINDHSTYLVLQHDLHKNWRITAQGSRFIYTQEGASMWPSDVNPDGTVYRNIGIWDAKSEMSMAQVFLNGDVSTGPIRHRILGGIDVANKEYIADWGQSHDLDTAGAPFNPNDPEAILAMPANGYPQFDRATPLEQRAYAIGAFQKTAYSSVYVQDELGFFNNFVRLTLAGRYTDLKQAYYGESKAQHFTPRVALSVSPTKSLAVYALYDQAFIPQSGVLSNGDKVQPITGNNMEVGVKRDWFDGKWNTTVAVYQILKNNELTADPYAPPFSGLSVELGQKRVQGVEFDLRGTVFRGFDLIANYAYTDSRITKVTDGVPMEVGTPVPPFAKHTVNGWVTYKIPVGIFKGFGASAGGTWLVDRATYWEASPDASKELGDYFKLDAGLFWEKNKFKITGNMFNVLNEYLYSGSYYGSYFSTPVYSYQTEAPRNLRVSVAYRF